MEMEVEFSSLSVADHLAKNRRFLPGGQMKEIVSRRVETNRSRLKVNDTGRL